MVYPLALDLPPFSTLRTPRLPSRPSREAKLQNPAYLTCTFLTNTPSAVVMLKIYTPVSNGLSMRVW